MSRPRDRVLKGDACAPQRSLFYALGLTQEELDIRRAKWTPPQMPPVPRGYLRRYAKEATSADRGAILQD